MRPIVSYPLATWILLSLSFVNLIPNFQPTPPCPLWSPPCVPRYVSQTGGALAAGVRGGVRAIYPKGAAGTGALMLRTVVCLSVLVRTPLLPWPAAICPDGSPWEQPCMCFRPRADDFNRLLLPYVKAAECVYSYSFSALKGGSHMRRRHLIGRA